MSKYRKLPIVIEAIQYTGNNYLEIRDFAKKFFVELHEDNGDLTIETLEGNMKAKINDYIIKGINGEIYPCKPDIFKKTYELIENDKKIENDEKLDFLIKQNYAMQKMIQALFIYEGMDRHQLNHTLDLIEKEMKEEGNWRNE